VSKLGSQHSIPLKFTLESDVVEVGAFMGNFSNVKSCFCNNLTHINAAKATIMHADRVVSFKTEIILSGLFTFAITFVIQLSANAQSPGKISSPADWDALFKTSQALGFDRIPEPNDITASGHDASTQGADLQLPNFRVVIKRQSTPTYYNFPPPATPGKAPLLEPKRDASGALLYDEVGRLIYENAGPALSTFLGTINRSSVVDNGSAVVRIKSAKYIFTPPSAATISGTDPASTPAILLSEKSDLTISGLYENGVRPEFVFQNPFADGIRIVKGKRVSVRGININYDYSHVIPGRSPSKIGKVVYSAISCGGHFIASKELPAAEAENIHTISTYYPATHPANNLNISSYVNPQNGYFRWVILNDLNQESYSPLQVTTSNEARTACINTLTNLDLEANGYQYFQSPRLKNASQSINAGEPLTLLHERRANVTVADPNNTLPESLPLGSTISAVGPGEDVIIENMRIFTCPNMSIWIKGMKGVYLNNNRIVPDSAGENDQRCRADSFHISGSSHVKVTGNITVGQGDDSLNIRGNDIQIAAYFPNPAYSKPAAGYDLWAYTTGEETLLRKGDKLVLLTAQNLPLRVFEILEDYEVSKQAISSVSIYGKTRQVLPLKVNWGDISELERIELSHYLLRGRRGAERLGNAFVLSRMSSPFMIEDNTFAGGPARGMIVQAPNGIIKNNEVLQVGWAAIALSAPNQGFVDAPGPNNVSLVNNTIWGSAFHKTHPENVLKASIGIGADDDAGMDDPIYQSTYPKWLINFPFIRRIVVRNNIISNSGQAGIYASRVSGVEVYGNSVANLNKIGCIDDSDKKNYVYPFESMDNQMTGIRKSLNWFVD
jgi:hypothetical protein